MRVALRQHLQQRRDRVHARKRKLVVEDARRGRIGKLDGVDAELVFKAGAPFDPEAVAGLQDGPDAPRPSALDEAMRAAIGAREDIGDDAGLAVRAPAQEDAVVSPSHEFALSAGRSPYLASLAAFALSSGLPDCGAGLVSRTSSVELAV